MDTHKWYIVHVYSGFEQKIAKQITDQANEKGLSDYIEAVLVPTETSIEIKKGQRVATESKFYPGYVLAKMILTDETWHLVKNIPKVAGFLGTKMRPTAIPDDEAHRVIKQLSDGSGLQRSIPMFQVGENIRVSDGPFATFAGTVEEIDCERRRLKVSVSIFGRSTPVELDYSQIEKG